MHCSFDKNETSMKFISSHVKKDNARGIIVNYFGRDSQSHPE